jgi:CYTH domain-containing protein
MNTVRRFLLASSLARLIERERGGQHVSEGYFPEQAGRSTYVRVEESTGSFVLVTNGAGGPVEEPATLPRAQAEALLDFAAGQVGYLRSDLSIGSRDAQISRFIMPGPLDLISVQFEHDEEARDFHPPPWFGPEVTIDASHQNRMIALEGLPAVAEVSVSDAALNSLLDTLENRFGSSSDETLAEPLLASLQTVPSATAEASENTVEEDDLGIEDSVIRELARSLRPHHR